MTSITNPARRPLTSSLPASMLFLCACATSVTALAQDSYTNTDNNTGPGTRYTLSVDGSDLTNSGTIDSTDANAILVTTGSATVTNALGALITGELGAIRVDATGTLALFNAGEITAHGANASAIYIDTGGAATIDNTGTIRGTGDNGIGISAMGQSVFIENNGPGALIQGGNRGVSLQAGGTVTNSGSIIATLDTVGYGIYGANQPILVTNDSTGLIYGGNSGIRLEAGGAITNSGTITGGFNGIESVTAPITVTNTTTGLIRGGYDGIRLIDGGTVINSGTIWGDSSYGIFIDADYGNNEIDITNHGVIHGGESSIFVRNATSFTFANDGVLSGIAWGLNLGSDTYGPTLDITNNSTGLVSGTTGGIWFQNGGTLANTGTIHGKNSAGVYATNQPILVTNADTGIITGGTAGVWLIKGGTVTNAGLIEGGVHGVYFHGDNWDDSAGDIINTGTILATGPGGSGAYVQYRGVIANTGGLIEAGNLGAYVLFGAITNTGTIHARDASSIGAWIENSGTINNTSGFIEAGATGVSIDSGLVDNTSGTIRASSDGSTGVFIYSTGTVTNTAGSIAGGDRGVTINGAGLVTNTGTITAASANSHGVSISTGTVFNTAGSIEGGRRGVDLGIGLVENTGAITATATDGYGVSVGTGTVNNAAAAAIKGGYAGVYIGDTGVVTNTGTIITTTTEGIGVHIRNDGVVKNDGFIEAAHMGVSATTGLVTNTGLITATNANSTSVLIARSGTVINTGGAIEGGRYGVSIVGSGLVENTGAITAITFADSRGVDINETGTVTNDGSITAGFRGVNLTTGLVNNTGLITGTSADSIGVRVTTGTVTNSGRIDAGNYGVSIDTGLVENTGTIRATAAAGTGVNIATGGTVTNAAGLIQGDGYGVQIGTGKVTNTGTILGSSGAGIFALGVADITNTPASLIQGNGNHGISLAAGGTVTNSGTIIGDAYNAIYAYDALGAAPTLIVTNSASALLSGGLRGIYFDGVTGTIINSSTISGTEIAGVYAEYQSVLVDNTTPDALISGGQYGIYLAAGGTVTNSGTIIGDASIGISASTAPAFITNAATALIRGGQTGISLYSGGTVHNTGTILGGATDGIRFDTGSLLVANAPGALIQGSYTGIRGETSAGALTVTNSGSIIGVSWEGIKSSGPTTITNAATAFIQGLTDGIWLGAGGSVTNSGNIIGETIAGIEAQNTSILITNATTDSHIHGGQDGIDLRAGGTVANSGTIIGDTDTGVKAGSDVLLVTNDDTGTIEGQNFGVQSTAGGGRIFNAGIITGLDSTGAFFGSSPATVSNTTGAIISGGQIGIHLLAGGTVSNAGTIRGNTQTGILADDAATTLVTNTLGGYIYGGIDGIWLKDTTPGTILNSSTIIGATSIGVAIGGPALVQNDPAAIIQGGIGGVFLGSTGAIHNSSTIRGATDYGVATGNAPVTINNDAIAIIQGGQDGARLGAGGGTIINSGTIHGIASAGVNSAGSLTLTNSTSALIRGGMAGIHLEGSGNNTTILNSSTIIGGDAASSIGIAAYNGHIVTATNNEDALIQGGHTGIYLDGGDGNQVRNAGLVQGIASTGIHAEYASTILNTESGSITGYDYGIVANGGGTVTNVGAIIGTNDTGISAANAPLTITNSTAATIQGKSYGINTSGGGDITNSGLIVGELHDGIRAIAASLAITNNDTGIITGAENGIQITGGGTIDNSGIITGFLKDGITGDTAPVTITNNPDATISGKNYGINLLAGGNITNSGTIGGDNAAGIFTSGQTTHVTNNPDSVIQGDSGVVLHGGGTVLNHGNITATAATNPLGVDISGGASAHFVNTRQVHGSVQMTALVNTATLFAGSLIAGNLHIAGGQSTLTLTGDATTTQLYTAAIIGATLFEGALYKTGAGLWDIDNTAATLAGLVQKATHVREGTLAVNWDAHQFNNALVDISAGAQAAIYTVAGTDALFAGLLTGAGELRVDLSDNEFTFGPLAGAGVFTGTVTLANTTMNLGSDLDALAAGWYYNADVLRNATLRLDSGSRLHTNAETRDHALGALTLNGGQLWLPMNGVDPVQVLHTGVLSLADMANSTVVFENYHSTTVPVLDETVQKNWLDQDGPGDNATLLVSADSFAAGETAGRQVDILMGDGLTQIAHGQAIDNPTVVAYYDYIGVTGAIAITEDNDGQKGLYYDYLLTRLDAKDGQTLVLTSEGADNDTLGADITGLGSVYYTTTSTMILNGDNTYTGTSTIAQGNIRAGVNNALGQTERLDIHPGAAFDLNGKTQAIANGGQIDGNLTGAGNLTLGGLFSITTANPGLSAAVAITGTTNLSHVSGIGADGAATIAANATLRLAPETASGVLSKDIIGAAATSWFVQDTDSHIILTGANDINLRVNAGTLQIGDGGRADNGRAASTFGSYHAIALTNTASRLILNRADTFTLDTAITGPGSFETIGTGTLVVARAQTYTGSTRIANGTLRAGVANIIQTSNGLTIENATLDLANYNQTIAKLAATTATIRYGAPSGSNFATLTVPGSFTGNTRQYMSVDLPNKRVNLLNIYGAATGTHQVIFTSVTTVALDDPLRTYALPVITFGSGDPLFVSNGIESGMFTYELYRGDGGKIMPNKNTYYLSGGDALSRAGDAILITAGVTGADWHYELDNVHKRMGDIRALPARDTGDVWVRGNAYRLNADSKLGGSQFTQDTYGITAGTDKTWRLDNNAQVSAGGFLAMSHSSRAYDDTRNRYGDGATNGAGIGAYVLWLRDDGWYVDGVVRFDRYSNTLNSRGLDGIISRAKFTSKVQGISIEAGRRFTKGNYWVEPSVMAAVGWINGADYTMTNGVSTDLRVSVADSDAWQYRAQVRSGLNLDRWLPYVKLGGVKTDTQGGRVKVDGRRYEPLFDGWRLETGVGIGYLIDDRSQVYFDYEYNKAGAYERPWSLNIGYRRAW